MPKMRQMTFLEYDSFVAGGIDAAQLNNKIPPGVKVANVFGILQGDIPAVVLQIGTTGIRGVGGVSLADAQFTINEALELAESIRATAADLIELLSPKNSAAADAADASDDGLPL